MNNNFLYKLCLFKGTLEVASETGYEYIVYYHICLNFRTIC